MGIQASVRSERTLDAVEHSRTLMEWWPFLIFHRGGLRIKVINNTSALALFSTHLRLKTSALIRPTLFALKFAFEIAPQRSINSFVRGQRKSNVL